MAKMSDNQSPKLTFLESAAPATPASGLAFLYFKTDGKLYSKNDAGTEVEYGSAGAGIAATIVDAKGDLIAATAADTVARLAAGANGTILEAQSGETTGLKWSALGKGRTVRTAGDLTYTSATFADVTGASITTTTGARRCLIVVTATALHSTSTFSITLDVDLDGARLGTTTWGLIRGQAQANGRYIPMSFSYVTDVLSAASHTFKLQAATDGATATLVASDPALVFAVHELA